MTQRRISAQLLRRRTKVESAGISPGGGAASRTIGIPLGDGITRTEISFGLPVEGVDAERIISARVTYSAAGKPQNGTVVWTQAGLEGWYVLDSAGATLGFVAQAVPAIQTLDVDGQRQDSLVVEGAVATLVNSFEGTGVAIVELQVAAANPNIGGPNTLPDAWSRNQVSRELVALWADDQSPPGDMLPDVGPLLARTQLALKGRGDGRVVLDKDSNQEIVVPGVAGTFNLGQPIVLAGDIGTGFGQINVTAALRTAAQFENHPRAFVRSSDHLLGLRVVGPAPEDATMPTTSDAGVGPLVAQRQPTFSKWLFVVDGGSVEVLVQHLNLAGAAIDVRRPRDIWEQVILPKIAAGGGQNLEYFDYFDSVPDDPATARVRTFYSAGTLETLGYLDYAACLDLLDSDTTSPILLPLD